MTAKRIDRLHNSFLCLRRERERERDVVDPHQWDCGLSGSQDRRYFHRIR